MKQITVWNGWNNKREYDRKKIIKILRKAIPEMKCKITCSDCCGPIPFLKWEWEQIEDKKMSCNGIV